MPSRPCSPSPCGINAYCHERFDTAICECIPDYRGNPYQGCQPECLVNTDCPKSQACIKNKCQDPCPGTCGIGAICTVSNHVPICSCPLPTIGDAFTLCRIPVEGKYIITDLISSMIKLTVALKESDLYFLKIKQCRFLIPVRVLNFLSCSVT